MCLCVAKTSGTVRKMVLEGALVILPGDKRPVTESAESVSKRLRRRLQETYHYRYPHRGDGDDNASSALAVAHLRGSNIHEPIHCGNRVLEEYELAYRSAYFPRPRVGSVHSG